MEKAEIEGEKEQTRVGPAQAIRAYCIGCSGGHPSEVALCISMHCPLYLYRFTRRPTEAEVEAVSYIFVHSSEGKAIHAGIGTRLEAIRSKCLDCSFDNIREVKRCTHKTCELHPFRSGHSTKVFSEDQLAAAADRMRALHAAKKMEL
jgi:hypothetical protein